MYLSFKSEYGMEWNGTPTITEPPSVECQDLLIPHRSMHGDDLRFQSQNDEISRQKKNFFLIIKTCMDLLTQKISLVRIPPPPFANFLTKHDRDFRFALKYSK